MPCLGGSSRLQKLRSICGRHDRVPFTGHGGSSGGRISSDYTCTLINFGRLTFKFLDAILCIGVFHTVAPHLVHSELWEQPVTLASIAVESYGVHQQILHNLVWG